MGGSGLSVWKINKIALFQLRRKRLEYNLGYKSEEPALDITIFHLIYIHEEANYMLQFLNHIRPKKSVVLKGAYHLIPLL